MRRRWLAVTIAAGILAGCNQRGQSRKTAEAPQAAAVEGAFCGEHGVLEAVCTKCNPALIPVFKAKGDWCEEHGFPESICPVCSPERGGRPAAEISMDDAPADGTKVRFKTKETARLAGLGFAKVSESAARSNLATTARLVFDAARVAQVNARSPGVVRAIRADIGAGVQAGAPLAIIESAAVSTDQSRVHTARSRVQVAEANHTRAAKLHSIGIVAEREVLAARQELEAAKAELASGQAALEMVGGTADGAPRYTLVAPISGLVTERRATIGRLVGVEEILFEVVDTSVMWAEVDIPESALPSVALGQSVALAIDGVGQRELSGKLSFVSPAIDPQTRTAKGRVSLPNRGGALRANMFGRATISIRGSRVALVAPRAAVQRAKNVHLVFVRLAEDLFEARRVQLGQAEGDMVEVVGRISRGDEVVTVGSFLLKTETLKEGIGAGCCEVEEPRR